MDAGRPEGGADARRERPAADLHEHAVGCLTGQVGAGISVISQPIVRPPSRHSAFSGPCTLNGTAPASTASRKRSTVGSPGGSSARRSHVVITAPSSVEAADDGRRRPSPARTPRSASRRRGRASPRRARRCRTRRSPAAVAPDCDERPRREPEQLGGPQVQQDREQVAGLVAAGDVAGLVLDPHAAVGREPELVGERVGAGERRDAESGAVDRGNRRVELTDERGPGVGGHAVGFGERGPRQLGVVARRTGSGRRSARSGAIRRTICST